MDAVNQDAETTENTPVSGLASNDGSSSPSAVNDASAQALDNAVQSADKVVSAVTDMASKVTTVLEDVKQSHSVNTGNVISVVADTYSAVNSAAQDAKTVHAETLTAFEELKQFVSSELAKLHEAIAAVRHGI